MGFTTREETEMDPNETLRKIREICNEHQAAGWLDDSEVSELVEYVRSLDEWAAKGGALPKEWTR